MTKQEEIREEVRDIISDGVMKDHKALDITDEVLSYLQCQGAVLKKNKNDCFGTVAVEPLY